MTKLTPDQIARANQTAMELQVKTIGQECVKLLRMAGAPANQLITIKLAHGLTLIHDPNEASIAAELERMRGSLIAPPLSPPQDSI